MIRALRRALAAVGATAVPRLRRDAALVLVLAAVSGGLAAWSQAAARSGLESIDRGAAEAVAAAGRDADLLVQAQVGADDSDLGAEGRFPPAAFLEQARGWPARLPAALRSRTTSPTAVLLAQQHDAERAPDAPAVTVTLAVPDAATTARLGPIAGRAAGDPRDGVVEVVVPVRAAQVVGLRIGSTFLLQPDSGALGETPVRVRVVGTLTPSPAAHRALGADLPGFADARALVAFGRPGGHAVTAFTTPVGAERMSAAFHEAWTGVLRLRAVPSRYRAATIAAVPAEVGEAFSSAQAWSDLPALLQVRSGLEVALAGFPATAAAAAGQQRVAIAGALAVGLVALLLLGSALAESRAAGLALERVRGLPGGVILVRAAAEALLVALPAVSLGAALAAAAVPGPLQPVPMLAVLVTAAAAPAVAEVRRSAPARPGGTRGVVADAALVLVSALALGLLRDGVTGPDDPLLVATPVLAALAGAVVVRRIATAAGGIARPALLRGRGAVAALAAARPDRTGVGLALTAVTAAAGVAVGGALLLADQQQGRVAASWGAVGADVRVTGALPPGAGARVAAAAGVTAATALHVDRGATLVVDDASAPVLLLGVDRTYPALLAAAPSAAPTDPALTRTLLGTAGPALPVLVHPALAGRVGREGRIEVRGRVVRVRIAGVARSWPAGDLTRGGVLVDAARLAAASRLPDTRDVLLADGPGAARAARGLPGERIVRSAVVDRARERALPAGVATAVGGASVVAALLALLSLAAWLRSTAVLRARERGLLAVLGLAAGTGRLLLLVRTGPPVLLAVAGGAASGAVSTRLLAPALGVAVQGGTAPVAVPVLPVVLLALVAAAAAVAVAALLEPGAARRTSLTALSTDGDPA